MAAQTRIAKFLVETEAEREIKNLTDDERIELEKVLAGFSHGGNPPELIPMPFS